MSVKERFLRYVSVNTQSCEDAGVFPSTENKWALAKMLAQELADLGAQNVRLDENCYVMAELPSNIKNAKVPALGLIAHMDTSPEIGRASCRERV